MNTLFFGTFAVYARCFIGIFTLSLVEAVARSLQLGALGDISGGAYVALEVPVWLARIGIVFVILGNGNPLRWQKGVDQLRIYLQRPLGLARAWKPVVVQAFFFGVFTFIINFGGSQLAQGIASQDYAPFLEQPEPIVFFIKNMIVIPLTIVFAYQAFCFIQSHAPSRPKKS